MVLFFCFVNVFVIVGFVTLCTMDDAIAIHNNFYINEMSNDFIVAFIL